MARSSVSARDVAELAGVSRAAVSRSFTPGASVSAETRAKVLAAAEVLGYQVNRLARGLIRAQSGLVALIVSEIHTPHRAALLEALTGRLQAEGKVPLVINADRSAHRGDAVTDVERALLQAISYRTEAAIVLSGLPPPSLAETCAKNGIRLVMINRAEERPASVRIRLDDADAGREAFALLQAAGCRRPALASSQAGTPSISGRETGFRAAAAEAGVAILEERLGATSYATGQELGRRLLDRPDRPDGVFCTTDLMACGLMDLARLRLGLKVPQDLSVIGFDDIEQAGWESYALTTFRQPLKGIADAAVRWIARPADPSGRAEEVLLRAPLVRRSSLAG